MSERPPRPSPDDPDGEKVLGSPDETTTRATHYAEELMHRYRPSQAPASEAAGLLAAGEQLTNRQFSDLRADLHRVVRRTTSSLSSEDVSDVADEAIAKFLSAQQQGRVHRRTALAYIRKIAKNETISRARRIRATSPLEDDQEDVTDNAIALIITRGSDAQTVERILAEAAASGNRTRTRVLNTYLDIAQSLGRSPSSRQVALLAEVSHSTVQAVLRQLRKELEDEEFDL